MRRYSIRLLTLATLATALAVIPVMTASDAEASSRHVRKHHQRASWTSPVRRSWASEEIRPVAPHAWGAGGGDVCPGNARGIDCRIWPPPIYDDPDRKHSGSDGGG